ncbi:L-histidine N(alpha)-methyltransferase [Sulfuricella sp.]|uniref:L-histidine N(alpha)-methyltransferase n=1 Tax=Sulfuricella sp. TaxID=2099377 RepID=UPI002C8D2E1D|nr:L-histidine N(alpha)-methyltransferase [Sulfuricella sp.]HUX63995.1 L-histidine N(alpha)-methyltransferase [Sulfuricella sp.]
MRYSITYRSGFNAELERQSLIAGLLAPNAAISPKYFYDELGSLLYLAICRLPEYYLTRTEASIFTQNREAITGAIGTGKQLVDLGAGDCRKAAEWFHFLKPSRYFAVDIAEAHLEHSLGRLAEEFPDTEIVGIVMDIATGLQLDGDLGTQPATFFYPGSSIGNFAPGSALQLLGQIRTHCHAPGSGLLIGVDAKKDAARLNAAYADPLGVTASFNLNILNHINRLIGSDFDLNNFRHIGFYNESMGRVEMHLEARTDCVVRIADSNREFAAGERIHTENSYKYARHEFESLLQQAGFTTIQCWQDNVQDFCVFYAA